MSPARRRGGGQAGMTLVELLVALGLSAFVLLGAAALIVELARAVDRQVAAEPLVGGTVDVALDRLGADLRRATDLPSRVGDFRSGPHALVLLMPDGGHVAHVLEGGALVRATAEPGSPTFRRAVLLRDVKVFDVGTRHGLVEVTLRRADEPLRARTILARNVVPPGHAP